MVFGVIMGVWIAAVGAYSFYFAYMMKQTGTIKAGWIISKEVQLKESRDLPAFIRIAIKKTNIFAWIAVVGGLFIIVGEALKVHSVMAVSMVVLIAAYIWYSSAMRKAEKQYLSVDLKKKRIKKINKKQ